jgi:thioredoxin-like negative regulator of GroEL
MARWGLLALALLMSAWLGIGLRQESSAERARELIERPGAPPAREVADLLDRAGWLNPDREVDFMRAQLAFETGDQPRAQHILSDVVADEPQNIVAWTGLALITADFDAGASERARAAIRRLAPAPR